MHRYFPILLLALVALGACAGKSTRSEPPPFVEQQRVGELRRAILALGDDVDPGEAQHAAMIAYDQSRRLAREYQIDDSPLLHNIKVNLGIKDRGLCIDWTEDMLTRLRQQRFQTLDLHWGIANYEKAFRIEHSSVIISARGAPLQQGLVLDPWRYAGELFWAPTRADTDYDWRPQAEVLALKRQIETERERHGSAR